VLCDWQIISHNGSLVFSLVSLLCSVSLKTCAHVTQGEEGVERGVREMVHYTGIFPEEIRKTTKGLNRNNRSQRLGLNPRSYNCEARLFLARFHYAILE
jgi:hypothetical protein